MGAKMAEALSSEKFEEDLRTDKVKGKELFL